MKLQRFNIEGIRRFEQFLDALSADPVLPVPTELLTDALCVVPTFDSGTPSRYC